MAVEALHVNLFHPHSLTTTNNIEIDIDDGVMALPSTMPYSTYHHHHHIHVLPRKRSRLDSITESNVIPLSQKNKLSSQTQPPSFLHIQHSEIDRFIALHTEKVRMELEEQNVMQSRKLVSVIQYTVEKKLMEKDEEIDRITKLNWLLQERVKSICAENQIWRELAHTNEATAISLRTNLEQVLAAQISEDHHGGDDDAESCCGSNCGGGGCDEVVVVGRMCKICGVRESIVLLLPCRHLCLCTMCGSTTRNCPLCYSGINASVHVNFD
ncbi:hypothetical protein Lal_00007689 [Lupinus albus]|uniref:Putative transcription factor C2H2 family n=1 Tax=Lupinus albus TaxID=3870 RepID=A0A6A5MTS6_LUPAL|nr:putative transcription factor C2H2 family [Lupinus albus]KAF1875073.1 hypothetical protein Lal_00007689 [Lupinus albus]